MKIVGCDLHTRYQQVAMLDQETGELIERRLEHESGEARAFYAALSVLQSLEVPRKYLISFSSQTRSEHHHRPPTARRRQWRSTCSRSARCARHQDTPRSCRSPTSRRSLTTRS